MYKYKFSVVVPIYNVEDYLEETILSVINQTIGFKENIQLILVNDGSPDNSHIICKKYKDMYPENIIYIEQPNGGVSSARNNGMNYIEGEIVNFLDSDDKWPVDAFQKVYNFMQENNEVNVVATMLEYFEAKTGLSHPLNYKFTGDKVIDTLFDANIIQMHMASCFIRADSIDVKFNENLKYGEDSLFINQIILKTNSYGVMKSVHYQYRKRASESSAIDTCQLNPEFYNKTLTNFHDEIIKYSKKKYNEVLMYVQYLVMYDMQWRIKREIPKGILTDEEIDIYQKHLANILTNIKDIVIINQKDIWSEYKIFALNLKYGRDITKELTQIKNDFYFHNLKVFSSKNKSLIKVTNLNVKNRILHIEGLINTPIPEDLYKIFIMDQDKNIYNISVPIDYIKREKVCVLGHYYYDKFFTADIELPKDCIGKYRFVFKYKNNNPITVEAGTTDTCTLNTSSKFGYLKLPNNIIEYKNARLVIRNNSRKLHLKKELAFSRDLWKKGFKKLVIYRFLRLLWYYIPHKEVWLISDRPDKAGDNGEAFFKYMQTVKNNNIKTYFVINKDSEDYEKMKKIGKVLNYKSIRYRFKFLNASKVISSQASDYVINPFRNHKKYIKDLYNFDFIFLQHGITKDDISTWLNKLSKDIKLFVTAGIPEYNSIINGNYYYGKEVVKLTGFPRHDGLVAENNKTKQIAIIPTWRKSIPGCVDKEDHSIFNKNFKETDFFKFYNSLINNEKLIKEMKKYGYTGLFCLHPLFLNQSSHFTSNDVIKVNEGYVDYQEVFKNYDMLITDYSSVFFDFSYLKKPVIYCQFDKAEFFEGHSYDQGYFDYEENGFGKVSYNLEDTVNNIIELIRNDCILDEKYEKRINEFYPAERGHNSENVYKAILALDNAANN